MHEKEKIMIKEPLVTLIIPAYNTEKYIGKCIESILEQSYQELEIIILDDGSQDETNKICQKYAKMDSRIILISKKNTGVSDTRNVGIHNANGKYIIFVDSDDYVTPNYVEVLVREVENENVQMACAEYFYVKEEKESVHESKLLKDEKKIISGSDAINMLHEKNGFQGYLWNKIFFKNIIINENILFDSKIKIWEDMLFCLKYLTKKEKVVYINKPVYYYVQRENSAINDDNVWNENTQSIALEAMWKIVVSMKGKFHNYIRDYYANDLAGSLGKPRYQDEKIIEDILKKIDELEADLSLKHKIKIQLFKSNKLLSKVFWK